jgi:hypothetical protein
LVLGGESALGPAPISQFVVNLPSSNSGFRASRHYLIGSSQNTFAGAGTVF